MVVGPGDWVEGRPTEGGSPWVKGGREGFRGSVVG